MFVPVSDYEELYEIDENGTIQALEREVVDSLGRHRLMKRHTLSDCVNHSGYRMLGLRKNGKRHTEYVHKLVYASFNHLTHSDLEKVDIDHIDGNKLNCHLSNLEAVTHKENMRRMLYLKDGNEVKRGMRISYIFPSCNGRLLKSNCKYCGKAIADNKTGLCFDCLRLKDRQATKRPPKDCLINDVLQEMSAVKIANKYGVTDKTVRKWMREYEIPTITVLKNLKHLYKSKI